MQQASWSALDTLEQDFPDRSQFALPALYIEQKKAWTSVTLFCSYQVKPETSRRALPNGHLTASKSGRLRDTSIFTFGYSLSCML